MKKTSVSLLVLLAICLLSLTLTPAAFSQSAPTNVKVVSYSYYFDMTGFLVVVGEVQNVGTDIVSKVSLGGTATSSDGAQVNSNINAFVADLLPGQKAPFYWEFYDSAGTGTWNHPDVTSLDIAVIGASTTTSYQYPDLKITGDHSYLGTNRGTGPDDPNADYGAYWVAGTLKNTGSQTAQNVYVLATYYNASHVVVAVGGFEDVVNASLAPSASLSIKVGAVDLNQTGIVSDKKITSYSLLIQVQGPILLGTSTDTPTPTVTPYPTGGTEPTTSATSSASSSPTSTDSSSIGASQSGSQQAWVYAIVVIVAIVVVAVALLLVKKRKNQPATQPKEAKGKK
jgi:hypothetical protein